MQTIQDATSHIETHLRRHYENRIEEIQRSSKHEAERIVENGKDRGEQEGEAHYKEHVANAEERATKTYHRALHKARQREQEAENRVKNEVRQDVWNQLETCSEHEKGLLIQHLAETVKTLVDTPQDYEFRTVDEPVKEMKAVAENPTKKYEYSLKQVVDAQVEAYWEENLQ